MDYVSTKNKARTTQHFAALVFSTIYIPGDERSRTNPGHGYPESNEPVVKYVAFDSREEMERWVLQQESRSYGRQSYQLIDATPLSVVMKASVSIGA